MRSGETQAELLGERPEAALGGERAPFSMHQVPMISSTVAIVISRRCRGSPAWCRAAQPDGACLISSWVAPVKA